MEHWSKARRPFAATLGAPALWLALFFAVPMGVIGAYSFGQPLGLTQVALTGTPANYARAFDPVYVAVFVKSVWLATLTTLLCLAIGFPVALVITFASERGKLLLLLGVMLPFWTNLLIRTYALMAVLRTQGYANEMLHRFGLGPWPLLHNNFAVVLGLVYVNLPFTVLPLYSALDRLDRSLLEASLDLGAGHLRTIREIVVPLARPGIASAVLITFIPALGSYLTPDLLGGTDSLMIANLIERQFKRANDWPFGAALSFLLLYPTFFAIAAQGMIARRRRRRDGR